jgi:hypothetical protein
MQNNNNINIAPYSNADFPPKDTGYIAFVL